MEINGEKTRFINLIKDIGDVNGKQSIREIASRFVLLDSFSKEIKTQADKLKKRL